MGRGGFKGAAAGGGGERKPHEEGSQPSSSRERGMLGLQQPAPAALQPAGARTSDAPAEAPRAASSSAVTDCVAKYKHSTPDSSLVRQLSDEAGSEEAGLQALVDIVRERERARLLQHSPVTTALQQPTLSEQRPTPSAPASSVDTFSDEFRMYHFKVRVSLLFTIS